MSDHLFAPPGGWRVRILDLSADSADNVVEEIGGFRTLMQANAFARAYVRDSVERCRAPGLSADQVLQAWFIYGEDVELVEAGDDAWRSAAELADFAARAGSEAECDWRALDPRRIGDDEDE